MIKIIKNFARRLFSGVFKKKGEIKLGFYGSPNAGKTSLANKICQDWLGEDLGSVSSMPHETRQIQVKEKVILERDGRKVEFKLIDTPGIATKIDFEDFMKFGLFSSFNGIQFDVPFLNKFFRERFERPHLDLRFILQSLGYRGGLKKIERVLGLDRKELADVGGYGAVLLWEHYKTTDNPQALETLLAYNALDVLNLELLMVKAYNMKLESTAFPRSQRLDEPPLVETPPFPVSREMIAIANPSSYY